MAAPDKRPGLFSLIRVCTERNGSRGYQRAVHHCISSLPVAEVVRSHWDVENSLHLTLDMQRLSPAHGL